MEKGVQKHQYCHINYVIQCILIFIEIILLLKEFNASNIDAESNILAAYAAGLIKNINVDYTNEDTFDVSIGSILVN